MTKEIHDINTRALDFVVELIDYIFDYPNDDYMTTECLCRKLLKHGLIDKVDGYYEPKDEPKTEYRIGYYTPTNAEILKTLEDEPRTCFNCKHNVTKHTFDHACGGCIKMDRYEREDKQSGKE